MVRPIALLVALAASAAAAPVSAQVPPAAPAALFVELLAHQACVLAPPGAGAKLPAGVLAPGRTFPLTAITQDVGSVTLDQPAGVSAGAADPAWAVKFKVNARIDAAVAALHGKPGRPIEVRDLAVTSPSAVAAVRDWLRQKGLSGQPNLHRVVRFDQPGVGAVTVVVSWTHNLGKVDPTQVHSVVLAIVEQAGKTATLEIAARYPGASKPDSAVNLIAIADIDGSGVPALVVSSTGEPVGASASRIEPGPKAVTVAACSRSAG